MQSFLVIRRDNIGDLVCTTPLIAALRARFPTARIDALVTSYNLPVLARNPDLDHLYAYTKLHHRSAVGQSVAGVLWRRARLMLELRRRRYDYVVLANCGCLPRPIRLARLVRPRQVIGFVDPGAPWAAHVDLGVFPDAGAEHEVEHVFRLLEPLGIAGIPGPLKVVADDSGRARARAALAGFAGDPPTLAVHISARKPSQRWPAQRFIDAMRALSRTAGLRYMLFWSPGAGDNPMHPGDDDKARAILAGLGDGFPVLPWPTRRLDDLINGLAACDAMLCSDGGAMHIGAALGLPVAALFGGSDPRRWRPWGVQHRVLQPQSRVVSDVDGGEVVEAVLALIDPPALRPPPGSGPEDRRSPRSPAPPASHAGSR